MPTFQHFPKTSQPPSGSLKELFPKLQAKVNEEGELPKSRKPPGPPQSLQAGDSSQDQAEKIADRSAVSLSQDEMEGLESLDEDNEQMRKVLLESKRMAITEEEQRRAAWAALGQQPPGPSRKLSTPEKVKTASPGVKLNAGVKTVERKSSQRPPKVGTEEKGRVVEKVQGRQKLPKEERYERIDK